MTTKSIIFHIFLRYELGCRIKPSARILHNASIQKMVKNTGSAFSSSLDNGVRSLSGKCSSIAIVTHDDTIVTKTVYSNGGHSMINFISRRNGLVSPNTNRDDGPGGLSVEFCAEITFTFTFTFWLEFVVVACVSTFAPCDASCMEALLNLSCFLVVEYINENGVKKKAERMKLNSSHTDKAICSETFILTFITV